MNIHGEHDNLNTYVMHQDPGHAWLQVPMAELEALNLTGCISSYSYISKCGTIAFLEEDCDFEKFHGAKKARGENISLATARRDGGWVRDLPRFPATVRASLTIV